MGEQHDSVDTPMVYHPQRLQVVFKRMPYDDSLRRYQSIERTTDRSKWQYSGIMRLSGYARETGVVVTAQAGVSASKPLWQSSR